MTKGAMFGFATLALGLGGLVYFATREKTEEENPEQPERASLPGTPAGGITINPNLGPLDCGGAPEGFCCPPGYTYHAADGLCYLKDGSWRSQLRSEGVAPIAQSRTSGCGCPDCEDA